MSTTKLAFEIPELLSLNIADKLSGLSDACFKEAFLSTGAVEYRPDPSMPSGRWYVERGSLERALGHLISIEDYRQADRALTPARNWQHRYRRRKGPYVPDVYL